MSQEEKAQETFAHKNERKQSHVYRKEKVSKKSASIRREMFDEKLIPAESRKIIENFDKIVSETRGMSGKQKVALYSLIKNLSHQLTDDRNSRRLGYMNEAGFLSAYINYFMWWNLVRLTRLFANLPKTAFESLEKSEKPVAVDIGSGTLTLVIALYLARPSLRAKKITWYCVDLSQTALNAGEELYLSVAAMLLRNEPETEETPWKIIRIKGALGAKIKEKADFVSCGNVFNEILQRNEQPTDFLAKKYTAELLSYLKDENSTVFLVEPGEPHSARFISLMRDALIRQNFSPVAPCPHVEECPMAGRTNGKTTDRYGKNIKWCNFAFDTDSAPKNLLKLSEKSGLPKERASLSFVISKKDYRVTSDNDKLSRSAGEKAFIRIASDFIRLPELHKSGYYACSQFGLLLAVDESHVQPKNGELLQIKRPENLSERDKKSGAIVVKI